MIPARLQYVTGTCRRCLPSTATKHVSVPPLARFSCSPSKAERVSSMADIFRPPPRIHNDEDPHKPLHPRSKKLFQQLGIYAPTERGVLQRINLPSHFAATKSFYAKYSVNHVAYLYHMQYFNGSFEHPAAPIYEHYYKTKKEKDSFWHWEYGSHVFGKNCLVIHAGVVMQRALQKSLKRRGFDYFGRRLVPDPSGQIDDLRGTLLLHAADPRQLSFKHELTRRELQEAVDYVVDQFIYISLGRRVTPVAQTEMPKWVERPKLKRLHKKPWLLAAEVEAEKARLEKQELEAAAERQRQMEAQKLAEAERSRTAWEQLAIQASSRHEKRRNNPAAKKQV